MYWQDDGFFQIGIQLKFGHNDPRWTIVGFLQDHPEYAPILERIEKEGVIVIGIAHDCDCKKERWSGYILHGDNCEYAAGSIYSGPRIRIQLPDGQIPPEEIPGSHFDEPKEWEEQNRVARQQVEPSAIR